MVVKRTLVLGHYVKHCRLTDQAPIRGNRSSRRASRGIAAVALCLPRRGCTLPPGNFRSGKPRARKPEETLPQQNKNTTLRVEVEGFPRRGSVTPVNVNAPQANRL